MLKRLGVIFSFIFLFLILVGCTAPDEVKVTKIDVIDLPEEIEIGTFDECEIKYQISYSDGTTGIEQVKEEMIPDAYRHFLYEEGTHKFNFLYRGVTVEFEVTMYHKRYTVTFLNALDEVVKEVKVKKDEQITYPTDEEMYTEGYRFLSSFDKDIQTTNEDVTIKGNYVKVWIVKFYNGLNELISTQIVDDGLQAIEPTEEEKKVDGYKFVMWDKTFNNITKNTNVYGIYELTEVTCKHEIVDATCEKASYCKVCEETFGKALGHNFEITEEVDETCTEDGYILYTCSNGCGLTKRQVIIAHGHDFNENDICEECGYILPNHKHNYEETVVKPTCTSMGYTLHECLCGHSYKDSYIEQSRHNWDDGTITKVATCTVDGEILYTCKDCNATLTHKIKAEHDYEVTVNVNATCTTDGEYTKECTKCGDKITEKEPAHHIWEEEVEVIKEATCKEAGEAIRKCTRCEEEEKYVIDKLGHTYVDGICIRCGESYLDHIVESNHPIYGMYFEIEETLSDYGPEIINEYGVLLDYNEEAVFDKVAVYLTQDGTMWRRTIACTGSNIEYATYVPYLSYGENIIYTGLNSYYINTFNLRKNSDGIWNYNNYTTIGVNLANNKGDLLLTLADIGQAGKETRLFDNLEEMIAWLKAEEICYKCDYVKEVIEPTCESEGYTKYTCKVCNHTYMDSYVEKKDHEYVLKENQNATCTTNGYNLYECSTCHKTKHETIKALGHNLETEKTLPTCTQDGQVKVYCTRTECDYEHITILKGEHNYEVTEHVKPTCTQDGHITYTCTKCSDSYEETLTTSHNYVETSRTEPKVGVKGSITYTCSKCSDSYSVELPAIDPINATKSILLIQDNLPWSEDVNRTLLNILKEKGTIAQYNIVSTSNLANVDLTQYAVVYIANDQSTSMYNRLAQNKEKLDTYVSIGGVLVYGVCDEGWGGSGSFNGVLPGGVTTNNNYSVYNYIMDNTHPVVTGEYTDNKALTNELLKGNYCSHTYFNKSTLVEGTRIILSDGNANPTLIEYTYGEGTVIATGLTWEYFYIRNHYNMSTNYSKYAFEDLLTYAMFISNFEKCEHEFEIEVVEAKCEEQGYTVHTCTKCNYTFKDKYTDALGHNESEWIIDEDSTCEKLGSKHKECTVCHKELAKEEIGYKLHNYQNGICTECGKEQYKQDLEIYEENGYKYVNFGRYPQTVVTDETIINALSNITITNELGYIEYNGNEYKKVVANPYDTGYTFINGNTIIEGNTYYFLVEPIKWRVLEENNGTYKLLCEMIIDNTEFYDSSSDRTINGQTIYPNNYEYSNIRAWLNGYDGTTYNVEDYTNKGFLDIAFTEEEKLLIKTTLVDNSLSSTDDTSNDYICNNTTDKIYLLSVSNTLNTNYGFSSDYFEEDVARRAVVSDYARSKDCWMSTSSSYYGNGRWWLRSHGLSSRSARVVDGIGGVNISIYVDCINVGVRPALTITIDQSNKSTVMLDVNGGDPLENDVIEIEYDSIFDITPQRDGYEFLGWYTENDELVELGLWKQTSDLTLVAKWKEIKDTTIEIYEENGYTYINLGRYPQTVVTEETNINALSNISTTNSLGYIEYNGNEYKKVVANSHSSNYTFINGNTIINGNTYYFLVEPIKWRVLEENNGTYKLLSEIILDNSEFYKYETNRTINGQTIYANNYEYSNIRAWLNGYDGSNYNVEDYTNKGFLDIAFTEEEQKLINNTLVDNSLSSTSDTSNSYICNNTTDKIYLLSVKDTLNTNYGFSSDSSEYDIERRAQVSDYARSKYCWMSTSSSYYGNGYWWLRSHSSPNSNYARVVYNYGYVSSNGFVNFTRNGVRPALTIII